MTARLAPEKIDEMYRLVRQGLTVRRIARKIGVSWQTVARYREKIEWRTPYYDAARIAAHRDCGKEFLADLAKYERRPMSLQFKETLVPIKRRLARSPESCALAWDN